MRADMERRLRILGASAVVLDAETEQISADVAANTSAIAGKADASDATDNATDILTNIADIAINIADIATNASTIAGKMDSFTLPEVFKAGGTSTASVQNVDADLTWGTPTIGKTSDHYSLVGANITIDTAGVYLFAVTARTTNANRAELIMTMYLNAVAQTDEVMSDYVARDSDQNTGAITLLTSMSLSAADVVKFVAHCDADGTSTLMTAGTRIVVYGPLK